MNKSLLVSFLMFTVSVASAQELPQPSVQVLPQNYSWFDGFAVTWAETPTQPYSIEIVETSGITVLKNLMEDIDILDVTLVEYQENEDSPNYPDAKLQITLSMIEASVGSTYTLNIPAGAVLINVSDSKQIPNEVVSFSFQLNNDENAATLPEPDIEPEPGEVENLSVIKMSWMGVLGELDLLNENNKVDQTANIEPVSLTINGEPGSNPEISFEWSQRSAMTPGAEGDILVITLTDQESLPEGDYIITIPENYLQISDVETGTLYNEEIVLGYSVKESSDDSLSVKSLEPDKDSNMSIYNLKGVKVNPEGLQNGIYIINGKKVLIEK